MNLQEKITIHCPADRVFAYLKEMTNRSDYIPLLEEVILLDDPPLQLGSRYIEVSTIAGRKLRTTYQVTEYEENRKISVQTRKSVFPIQVQLNLIGEGDSTIVRIQLEFELSGIYRLAAPLIGGIVRKQAQDILLRLKQRLETE